MKTTRWKALLTLLSLGVLGLLPRGAAGGEIPFFLDMSAATDCVCIECDGPWLRSSSNQGPYDWATADPINFYSAVINIFSPFGVWKSGVVAPQGGCQGACPGMILAPTPSTGETRDVPPQVLHICVEDSPGLDRVDIQVIGTTASSNLPSPPCPSGAATARAFLGDSSEGKRDQDAFRFTGDAGETVEATLEPDPKRGHQGSVARLAIVGPGRGPALGKATGLVPLQVRARLPRAGSYQLVVEERGPGSGNAFRGAYILRLNRPSGSAPEFTPVRSVEAFQ
jgi:hypothetical protein